MNQPTDNGDKVSRNTGALNRSGRKKGVPNKLTKSVKDAFNKVFDDLQAKAGDPASLREWARANPTDFYRICARMIPQSSEVTGKDGKPIEFAEITWRVVDP